MDVISYSMAKKYSNMVALGLASATVDDVNKSITFTLAADGSQHTIHFNQPSDGQDGISITGVNDLGNGKFTLLLSDGSETDPIQTVKGQKGDKGDKLTFNDLTDEEKASLKGSDGFSPSAKIEKVGDTATITITDKDGTTTATIKDGQGGTGGSGEENTIESISVNGVNVVPDENKNVDITVPSIEGLTKDVDLATVAKSGSYEDLSNKPIIPDITGLATEAYVDNKVADYTKTVDLAAVATSGSYNDLADKPTIPSLDGYAKTSEIPSKVSDLENDSNYLSSIPEEYVTETELSAKGYLTEHQDISGKVDKVEGKSLISDTEIARLATVDNYDDTDIKAEIAKKADATAIPSKVSELTNDSNYQTAEQVNSTVTTEIAKVVADAPEDLNTLKEMSDWIAGHEDDASAMNSAISDNKTAIASLQSGKADKSEIPTTVAQLTDSADYAKKTDLHSHDNKTVLDGITSTKVSNWDSAKTHADSAHAPSNAQENVLETVKVNGTALEVSDKAVNVTVPTTVAELTDSADYAKTTDIPTALPANGGNSDTVNGHTVETDVPENAVFTDTIYDDTEVKGSIEELNSNLDRLEYSDVAGGKNLFKYNEVSGTLSKTVECSLDAGTYTISALVNSSDTDSSTSLINFYYEDGNSESYLLGRESRTSCTVTLTKHVIALIFHASKDYVNSANDTFTYSDIQIEKGTTATQYESYIPSVKMLAEENAQQSSDLDALEFGEVAGGKNKFDFGNKYGYEDKEKLITSVSDKSLSMKTSSQGQTIVYRNKKLENLGETTISFSSTSTGGDNARLYFKLFDANGNMFTSSNCNFPIGTYNDYYEGWYYDFSSFGDLSITFTMPTNVAFWNLGLGASTGVGYTVTFTNIQVEQGSTVTPYEPYIPSIKMLADEVNQQNESLSVIGKCKNLLNPTLQTTTQNDVTCTNNGDGTYTINGTASSDVVLELESYKSYTGKEKFRLVGCPNGGSESKYYLAFRPNNAEENRKDIGSGVTFNDLSTSNKYAVAIIVLNGTTVTNLTFKPMLVNLDEHPELSNITYDDFVPYTGDGDTLTHDVAELKNDLSVKKFELVAGTLWLCVSGKHCVLTLNGYNLTESTHFDKLEEYQPYLVARNVVSKGDGVCIAAVEPNGNINASDLVVGTQLTGQLFGEISWIANI